MKNWMIKTKNLVNNQKGETLTEGLASLLIFTILLLAVTAMLATALRITGASIENAKSQQETVNQVLLGATESPTSGTIEFTFTEDTSGKKISVDINITQKDGMIAFAPKE